MTLNRRGFRFALNAPAEIAPEASPNATVRVRATELSLHGCYVESPAPFPVDTIVLVKIFYTNEYFECKATVIYVKPNLGMGLEFRDFNPYCKGILQKWILAELHKEAKGEEESE
jgi:hypothetical protein